VSNRTNGRVVLNYDGFGNTVMHALAVGVNEELDESEASFKQRRTVAEAALKGLPEGNFRARERDNANVQEAFADREAVRAPDDECGVKDKIEQIFELARVVLDRDVEGVMRGFDFDVLVGEFNGDKNQEDHQEIYTEGGGALPEGGQLESCEGFEARKAVWIKEARRLGGGGKSFQRCHGEP